jgi:hypothetical protein
VVVTFSSIVCFGFAALAVALILLFGQMPFASSVFEYGKVKKFEGIVEASPYPTLLVRRPGEVGRQDVYSRYLLVAPGKHGADSLVRGLIGQRISLQGQLIYRDGRTMAEVVPSSIAVTENTLGSPEDVRDLGPVTLSGEIVDSKCYLGVMNPGQGKVHRDCASRCLSGGIPPLFITNDGKDQLLLVGLDGKALGRDALREFIAEPTTLHGELLQRGDDRLLRVDPQALRH